MGVVESNGDSVVKIIPLTADLTRSRVSSTDHMWLHVGRACGQRTVRRRCSAHTQPRPSGRLVPCVSTRSAGVPRKQQTSLRLQ